MAEPIRISEPADAATDVLRTAPHNFEAERALLGSILSNNKCFDSVGEFLRGEHFADELNGRIFETCRGLIETHRTANPITLKSYMEADPALISAGGMKYLAALVAGVVTSINTSHYGRLIHDLSVRRELIVLGRKLTDRAYDADIETDPASIIEGIETELQRLTDTEPQDWAADIGDEYDLAVARWEDHDRGNITGLSSGLKDMDDACGLRQAGDLIIYGARPGMCKTMTAQGDAYHTAKHFVAAARRENSKPKWVAFFTAEMTRAQLTDRLITTLTGIPSPRQRRRQLDGDEWALITNLREEIRSLPIRVIGKPAPTLSYIKAVCRRLERRGGVGLIIVDYLQIMGLEREAMRQNRTDEVAYLARGLKEAAKFFDCPVIALSQLNRKVEDRPDKRPRMSDLREAGEIEAAADTIKLFYRPAYYLEQEKPEMGVNDNETDYSKKLARWSQKLEEAQGKLEVVIGKARHAEAGKSVTLHVDLARGLIENFSYREGPRA